MKSELDDDRELWDLLGRAGSPVVPRRFAADVIRAVRAEHVTPRAARDTSPWQAIVRWVVPMGATAAAALCLFLANPPATEPNSLASQSSPLTFREAAEFDSLVSDSAGWAWHEVAP
jgi:hypothetical protein